jgi:hypothetical protein
MQQTKPPIQPKNQNKKASKRYMYESYEYVKNQCKWKAAQAFCKQYEMEFIVITEDDIFFK